jgi:hypothetical protein
VTVGKVVPDWVGIETVVPEGSVVVVLSPPNGGVVVITEDVGSFGPAVLALLVQPAIINVRATAATAPILRTERIMAPPVSSVVSRNGTLNDDLTQDCASV